MQYYCKTVPYFTFDEVNMGFSGPDKFDIHFDKAEIIIRIFTIFL